MGTTPVLYEYCYKTAKGITFLEFGSGSPKLNQKWTATMHLRFAETFSGNEGVNDTEGSSLFLWRRPEGKQGSSSVGRWEGWEACGFSRDHSAPSHFPQHGGMCKAHWLRFPRFQPLSHCPESKARSHQSAGCKRNWQNVGQLWIHSLTSHPNCCSVSTV